MKNLLALALLLVATSSAAAVIPQPGHIGMATADAEGFQVGGVTLRVMLLEGSWPQETLYVETEPVGLEWRAVNTGLYEIVALDGAGQPITESALTLFVPSGAMDIIVVVHLPPTCAGDVNGNGTVDFTDLVQVLAAWGPCAGCPEDVDDSGAVDFTDLLTVLGAWGECGT